MTGRIGKWPYWMTLYLGTHCTARGLSPGTIAAYDETLRRFRAFTAGRWLGRGPDRITARDVLEYIDHLRTVRGNGDSAVNRCVAILKSFYRAIVAMGHLEPRDNPLAHFPKIKAPPRKLVETLTETELPVLLDAPRPDTIMGLRDRAILSVLSMTGIRASECSGMNEGDVDLDLRTIRVTGKGGHDRTLPLNDRAVQDIARYRIARGARRKGDPFLVSRKGRRMSRNAIYERVRRYALKAKLKKKVTPHQLRHTFGTQLVRAGVNLVTIRDLLGHRQITSTQIYLHMTAHDLRQAADRHPVAGLVDTIQDLLPAVPMRFQRPPAQKTG